MEWDDTTRRKNPARERYTHEVRDGVMTHKCVAIITDLQTGREERFAVLQDGTIYWRTEE